ncbi:hypothetical protein [Nocardioides hwasunensis]|uniref:Uncharacterized protein n=1 Tax=Nocardioides hwasunensis TaxID=397258 RepID=A0ABR8MBS1_9ACTN|nr:hypothetical protein [Nocardioides hwasunensis]MBD3913573.1 hypothetical protein [Nocardioides hwasunensis]
MMVRDGVVGAGSGGRVPSSLVSRAGRRAAARGRASLEYGAYAEAALDLLELLELAWHDCYGEVAPPPQVLDDVWRVADGDLGALASAARLAVTDRRDLRVSADRARELA